MSDHIPANEDDDDLTAAEYVLGLTDAPARARAAARRQTDPAFSAAVDAWEARFAPLIDQVTPVDPPPAVWERIAAAVAAPSNVVDLTRRPGAWNNIALWRAATGGALAAAAACLALVVGRPASAPPPPPVAKRAVMVATLAAPDAKALFVATFDPARGEVTVVPVKTDGADPRAPELWIIHPGAKPRAVGMLSAARARAAPVSAATVADWRAGDTLAVSLEPAGGSPTGAPTGPVIAAGALTAI